MNHFNGSSVAQPSRNSPLLLSPSIICGWDLSSLAELGWAECRKHLLCPAVSLVITQRWGGEGRGALAHSTDSLSPAHKCKHTGHHALRSLLTSSVWYKQMRHPCTPAQSCCLTNQLVGCVTPVVTVSWDCFRLWLVPKMNENVYTRGLNYFNSSAVRRFRSQEWCFA